ncbi:hydroxyacid dehydrogenase [Paraoerskovia sediminicola]|uniref:Hydroxyacid dehydrogenase n=1 Tax=Paraoerskovia sediminicola TaxID=1138587 RepID=A0ABM8G0E9_9CELL|nr:hydroxyacid dehydrogenase [Paraoerskovia sediminicola]BDZ41474.1 hydroxyacid dehydrogenase [Paraoerskovia sediminicola]
MDDAPSGTRSDRPTALLLMDRRTFDLQFHAEQLDRLAGLAQTTDPVCISELDSPQAIALLAQADVVLTSWGAPALTAERLARAPRLRAVLHCAGTVRGVLPDRTWDHGLLVTSAADENARPVAEFTLAAIILAGKKAPFIAADSGTAGRGWSVAGEQGELSNRGRTVGLVGLSRIGRKVLDLLRILETGAVLVADPTVDAAEVASLGAELVELDELVRRSDIVSLHAPALPSTYRMIGAAELAAMPDGATLINTARGSLVDTAALEAECASGRIDAILDVTDPEPLPAASPLHTRSNVMVTPHIAGSLGSETRRMSDHALDELERWIAGEAPLAPVTREHLDVSA